MKQGEFAVFLQGVRSQGAAGFFLMEKHLQALGQKICNLLDSTCQERASVGLGGGDHHMAFMMPVGCEGGTKTHGAGTIQVLFGQPQRSYKPSGLNYSDSPAGLKQCLGFLKKR